MPIGAVSPMADATAAQIGLAIGIGAGKVAKAIARTIARTIAKTIAKTITSHAAGAVVQTAVQAGWVWAEIFFPSGGIGIDAQGQIIWDEILG